MMIKMIFGWVSVEFYWISDDAFNHIAILTQFQICLFHIELLESLMMYLVVYL